MARFIYKVKKSPNEILDGSIEAESEEAAVSQLLKMGYFPIQVKREAPKETGASFFIQRIKKGEIANLTRQLAELLDSGLTLHRALNIVEEQTQNPKQKLIIKDIADRVKEGATFSDALKNYPEIFSRLYVNIVRSGEAGSMLSNVLSNVANFLEKEEEVKEKIKSAITYPIIMASVGILTVFVLLTFVVPRLVLMFKEMGEVLPLPTRILIGTSDFIRHNIFLITAFIVFIVIFIKRATKNIEVKFFFDELKLKFPIFGSIIRDTELSRFARTLSTLLGNGVPILYSIEVVTDIIENQAIKRGLVKIYQSVKEGSSLTAGMKKSANFPLFILHMVAVGEEGGFLEKTLLKVANSYQQKTERSIRTLTTLLEPILILSMGLVVGFIVISMLLPIFQISLVAH